MVLFGLMFLAEAGDLYGLVLTLADPVPAADRFGITASAEVLRSIVLLILALVICLGALLALVGLLARRPRLCDVPVCVLAHYSVSARACRTLSVLQSVSISACRMLALVYKRRPKRAERVSDSTSERTT